MSPLTTTTTSFISSSLLALTLASSAAAETLSCSAAALHDAASHVPTLRGVQIQEVLANPLKDWMEEPSPVPRAMPLVVQQTGPLSFCNVTVVYTHPGHDDSVRVNVWLPLEEKEWNGNFFGQGGGGYAAGTDGALAPALSMGYAAANGDAGHSWYENALDSSSWATKSPHNVNYHLLSMLGHRSLEELTLIAKHVTESYYGKKIKYSYWSGCSTGGRQGMVLAQRYPTLYQGIYAVAPAMNWVTFIVAEFYPQIVMKALNYYPAACELNAITAAAVEACDELDGVKDGIISAPGQCKFDPQTIVGQEYDCAGSTRKITTEAAKIASATWSGPKDPDTGKSIWFGLTPDASLPGLDPNFGGLASTTCNEDSTECKPRPFPVSADWIRNWLLKDPEYDLSAIDEEQFHNLLITSYQEYTSAINTADPDLRRFQKSGGKLLSWHGLHDQVISPNGTSSYHDRVAALVGPNVKDFFRHFEAPGVAHCFGGPGAYPTTGFQDLVRWVEHDEPVEELVGRNIPWPGTDRTKIRPFARILCPWPQVASYKGGDEASLSSFECRDGFDLSKMKKKEEVKAAKDEL